jgi:DNA-binding NtrC family response regulator
VYSVGHLPVPHSFAHFANERRCVRLVSTGSWAREAQLVSTGKRLLLVENYEDNVCQILAGVFQTSGFETELATTLAGCVDAVRTRSIDMVLMITNNIHNPDAFDVADAIRALHPNCGFVFLAGTEPDGREPFLTAGYQFRVYPIPLPTPELLTLVSQAMTDPAGTFVIPKPA